MFLYAFEVKKNQHYNEYENEKRKKSKKTTCNLFMRKGKKRKRT